MATNYTFNFTDGSKASFSVQSYTSNGYISPTSTTLLSTATRADTSLKLYGKGHPDYGEGVEQSLIYMLENFASTTAPVQPIEGQLWYYNAGGSPPASELFIRNDLSAWTAVMLATGTSTMTGDLNLGGNFIVGLDGDYLSYTGLPNSTGVSKGYVDNTTLSSISDDTMNGSLTINGSLDVGTGITLNSGDFVLAAGSPNSTIRGLPAVATYADEATSKAYVDAAVVTGGADGVLSATAWTSATGSPPETIVLTQTTLALQLTIPTPPFTQTLLVEGISRDGHGHAADEITIDNTSSPVILGSHGGTVQSALEAIELTKAPSANPELTGTVSVTGDIVISGTATFNSTASGQEPTSPSHLATKNYVDSVAATGGTGGSTTSSGIFATRELTNITSTITAGTPVAVQGHTADDNLLMVFLNGVKQYAHTHARQQVQYDTNVGIIDSTTYTGLDQSIDYVFDITVDGVGPTLVTIPAGTTLTLHGNLINAINAALTGTSPNLADVRFYLEDDDVQTFVTYSSGTGSTILISDPGGSPTSGSPPSGSQYLFAEDLAPTAIISAQFNSEPPDPASNPDVIVVNGDVTSSFPANKAFTIRGSSDATYGNFDGVYRVHVDGALYAASPGVTYIPIGWIEDYTYSTPLLGSYQPGASPSPTPPSPSSFGSVHFTPIGGFDTLTAPVDGVDGDYEETDALGNATIPGVDFTGYATFDNDITAPTKMETTLFG